MKFIADFHIHSHFSIATSKDLIPEELDFWAQKKGIQILGTGDFSHPGWLTELKEKLEPSETGLYTLKKDFQKNISENTTRFILTAEISNIYKKNGKVRKVHNVLFAPNFQIVEKIQNKLSQIGNITSDGRPILGLDSRDLLEIVLEVSEDAFLVPAHIWTPWFSALGSKSGFETIEECYGDLSDHIFAVETGLSSDPPMNWVCSFLDKYTLISNSDAHSPSKLGREANLFDTELDYFSIRKAMEGMDEQAFLGTVEFFPQEGKYHFDGHRKCGICWDPLQTLKQKGICTVCGKKVTIGVLNRVAQLADRADPEARVQRHPFHSLITLPELLSEILCVGPNTKTVKQAYESLLNKFNSEFDILLHAPISEIEKNSNEILSEAISRMRNGQVHIQEGYDGEYGVIKVFTNDELKDLRNQEALFRDLTKEVQQPSTKPLINFDIAAFQQLYTKEQEPELFEEVKEKEIKKVATLSEYFSELNPTQQKAVSYYPGPLLILAGPGTGKTRTLTARIAYLINERGIKPSNILAVTFTNKAADEMKERLDTILSKTSKEEMNISTFHAFGYNILKEYASYFHRDSHFSVIDEDDKLQIFKNKLHIEKDNLKEVLPNIIQIKQKALLPSKIDNKQLNEYFQQYETLLKQLNLFDLDDLIYKPVLLFRTEQDILTKFREKLQFVLIDEFQDINAAQYMMIQLLKPDRQANITAIGDPNQAIYGFRGADVGFINYFKNDYPDVEIINLTQSYRCSDKILKASQQVLELENVLYGLDEGLRINISQQPTDKSEAEFIARTIEQLIGGVRFFSMDSAITDGSEEFTIGSLSDIAILCRIQAMMPVLEKALNDHSIPYQKASENSFFTQEPVKSILDVLHLAMNPRNMLLMDSLLKREILSIPQLNSLKECMIENTVQQALEQIIEKYFQKKFSPLDKNKEKLLEIAETFEANFEAFMKYVTLGTSIDTHDFTLERVHLLTLHAAKGLEFDCVFIPGCEDGIIPYSLFEKQQSDPEEEKRLFYVGMTRARKYLYLTHAVKRFLFGKHHQLAPSTFLKPIQEALINRIKTEYSPKKSEKQELQENLF